MSEVTSLIGAGFKARKAFRNWRNNVRARKGEPLKGPQEGSMNSTVVIQIVYGLLRHAMTAAAPLGIVVSDDVLIQVAGLIVGLIGAGWMAIRKIKKAPAAA